MTKQKQAKVVFITGCSSGFGCLTASLLAKQGYKVYATMRDVEGHNAEKKTELEAGNGILHVLDCDVLDEASIKAAVADVIAVESRIDVLVNNAGYGLYGPIELVNDDDMRKQFETNVLGYMRVISAVMPHMRKQRNGLIINVGSMFAFMGLGMTGYYVATKFAILGLSEALLGEGYLFNIKVSFIYPMGYGTNFLHRSLQLVTNVESSGEYKEPYNEFIEKIDNFEKTSGDPIVVAKTIAKIIKKKNPSFTVPIGRFAGTANVLAKFCSPRTMQKIITWLYHFPRLLKKIPKKELQ